MIFSIIILIFILCEKGIVWFKVEVVFIFVFFFNSLLNIIID